MTTDHPPIVTIGYSRYRTLQKSLTRLSECHGIEEHDCFLFLDAPYCESDCIACDRMIDVARQIKEQRIPNLQIIKRTHNYGVPGNLLSAISDVIERYGKIIFFEDDVLVSRTFLSYMDQALATYEKDKRIFCINGYKSPYLSVPRGYSYDVYLNPRNMAWGFGTWKDRWSDVDFYMKDWAIFQSDTGKLSRLDSTGCDLRGLIEAQLSGIIHTWDVQCTYHMVKHNLYAIEPRYSLTKNIGFGINGGVHCHRGDPVLEKQQFYDFMPCLPSSLRVDPILAQRFKNSIQDKRLIGRFIRKLKRYIAEFQSYHYEPKDFVK